MCCVCVWLNQYCLACRPVAADPKASRALLNPSELRFLRYVSHSLLSLYPLLYALPVVNTELRTTLLVCTRWWCSAEGLCYCILAKDRKGNFPYTVLRYIIVGLCTVHKIRLRFTKWRKYFSIDKHLNRN